MIKARVIWGDKPEDLIDCHFAYPLREGDSFAMGAADERSICKVETVLHVPVNIDSGATASVMYKVSKMSTKNAHWTWPFWRDVIAGAIKG